MPRKTNTPPLTKNDQIIINAVRRSESIEIRFGGDGHLSSITISSRSFAYDVSNAIRNYAVEYNKNRL